MEIKNLLKGLKFTLLAMACFLAGMHDIKTIKVIRDTALLLFIGYIFLLLAFHFVFIKRSN